MHRLPLPHPPQKGPLHHHRCHHPSKRGQRTDAIGRAGALANTVQIGLVLRVLVFPQAWSEPTEPSFLGGGQDPPTDCTGRTSPLVLVTDVPMTALVVAAHLVATPDVPLKPSAADPSVLGTIPAPCDGCEHR